MDSPVPSNYPRSPESHYYQKGVMTWVRCLPMFVVFFALVDFLSLFLEGTAPNGGTLSSFLARCLVGVCVMLPTIVIICRFFKITISASGLKSYTMWGTYNQIPWDSLEQIRPLNIGGLRYHRFKGTGSVLAILIPYDLENAPRLCDEMARYLGNDSPIVAKLRGSWKLS